MDYFTTTCPPALVCFASAVSVSQTRGVFSKVNLGPAFMFSLQSQRNWNSVQLMLKGGSNDHSPVFTLMANTTIGPLLRPLKNLNIPRDM